MRHSQSTKLAAALTAAACLLAACTSQPAAQPVWPEPELKTGQDLPVGSELDTNVEYAPVDTQEQPAFGSVRPDPTTTIEDRVPEILERGRLIVGVAQSLNRLGFRDPVTGNLAGFEVDLAHEIARDIFGDPNKVEFRYADSRDRAEILNSGEVDMIIRTMSATHERQKNVEFSSPYLQVSNRLLVLENSTAESIEDLADKRICVARNSTSAQVIKHFHIGELLITDTWTDCLMAMQRHQTDAIFTDDAILAGLQTQDPYTRLINISSDTAEYAVGMASPTESRRSTGLAQQVNLTMERITKDGTWGRIYDEWLSEYLGPASPPRQDYRSDAEDKELQDYRHGRTAATATQEAR